MARRRDINDLPDDEGSAFASNPFPFGNNEGGPGIGSIIEPSPNIGTGPGQTDEFGNVIPDFPRDQFPRPFEDYDPTEIAGDRTTSREMFDRREPKGLPQGMTVQSEQGYDSTFGGPGGGQESFSTPAQPFSPTPIASQRPNPTVTQRVSSPGATSALFADASGGTPMFGRLGGLTGGGKGVMGSNEGGPAPTAMMLKLLRMFGSGA